MGAGAGDGSGSPGGLKPGALTDLLREVAAVEVPARERLPELPEGTVLGRFEILRELGRGGFGVVYEARDRELGRMVALKLVRPGRAEVGEGKVVREAEAIARLTHPNLITLHDVGKSEHGPYLVFELLRGKTLEERMQHGPLPVQEAVHVAVEVARGLAHAHAEGVVHRDLKPSNVFITDRGLVKILDFGMAHAFGRRRLSGGTPAYMAPEQWMDAPEDERTDVFALGVMLYRMLSGEYPFPEDGGRWSSGLAAAEALEVPGAPGLSGLVARMLEKPPTSRPRDGAAALAALQPIEDGLRIRAASGAPAAKATRRKATLGDLVAELKRRHVFRVMLGYGIFSFAVLQVIEPVMHALRLRDWVLSAALAALAVGFPVAVILAWLYDFTSRGVERTPSGSGPLAGSRARFLLPLAAAAAVLSIGAVGAGGWYAWKHVGTRRPAAVGDRTTVAVADFANETRDPELDGLSGLLITSLEQSKKLRVLTRSRMLDHLRAMGGSATDKLDEAMVRDVGRRADVQALLLTSMRKLGGTYVVEMRAIDPEKDEYLFTLKEQTVGKDGIIALIERLSDRARLALRESSGDVTASDVKVGQAITGSLEAYQHYFQSQVAFENHDFERSLAEARKALEIDPGMALAHAWIAWLAEFSVAGYEDPVQHIQAAMARAAELPPKERRFVEALDLMVRRQPETEAALRQLADDYPQEKLFALFAGASSTSPLVQRAYLQRALAIDPTFPWAVYLLRPPDVMLSAARRAVELRPEFRSEFNLALALGLSGQVEEALAAARRAKALAHPPPVEVDAMIAAALASLGRHAEAEGQLEPWLRPDVSDVNRHMALWAVEDLEALQGKRAGALRHLREDMGPAPSTGSRVVEAYFAGMGGDDGATRRGLLALKDPAPRLAVRYAELGLAEQSRALADRLPAGHPDKEAWRAVSEWRAGRPEAAIPIYEKFLASTEARESDQAYLLGRMLADAGRCGEAVVEFDRLPRLFPWVFAQGDFLAVRMPLALLESARCNEKLGRKDQARERLDRLLSLWKHADPDLPALAEAKAMRARLSVPR